MTTINSQEDFLRALAENPQWKEAVRAQLLGDDLLQLPARFDALLDRMDAFVEEQKRRNDQMDAFVEEQRRHNDRMDAFVEEQKRHNDRMDAFVEEQKRHNDRMDAFVEEQKQHNDRMDAFVEQMTAFVEEQRRINDRMDRRMTTLSNDVGQAKGGYARFFTVQYGPVLIMELNWDRNLGLEYVRDVTRVEIASMAQKATGGDIPTPGVTQFWPGRPDSRGDAGGRYLLHRRRSVFHPATRGTPARPSETLRS